MGSKRTNGEFESIGLITGIGFNWSKMTTKQGNLGQNDIWFHAREETSKGGVGVRGNKDTKEGCL